MWSDNGADGLTRTQQARRADIIAAAIELLDREGVTAASTDQIARQARTSKSTVLYHFKTKDAIFEAVVADLYTRGAAYMSDELMARARQRDRLQAYLESNLRFIANHRSHVNAVLKIVQNTPIEVDGYRPVGPLRQLIERGQEAGEIGDVDAEVLALTIRAVIDSAATYLTTSPATDLERLIKGVVDIFDRATTPKSSRQESQS